jgi:molecular chaperone Hsp33
MSKGQEVAVIAVNGTEIVRNAQQRHKMAPTPLSALGRALMGALLMCVYRKADESLQITFLGDGPLQSMQVIAESGGFVKGRVGNPTLELPLRPDGKVDVGGAVGKGATCFNVWLHSSKSWPLVKAHHIFETKSKAHTTTHLCK